MVNDYTIEELNKLLYGLLGSQELIDLWWNSRNKSFDNLTPLEVFNSPDKLELIKYIFANLNH